MFFDAVGNADFKPQRAVSFFCKLYILLCGQRLEIMTMNEQKIDVRVTETDAVIKVLVFSKHPDKIEVVLGEGVHSVKCTLAPTPNGMAYVGSAMGREIVYERSREQVKADIELETHDYRDSRRR